MAFKHTVLFIVFLIFTIAVKATWSQCLNATALSMQVDALLAGYDREVPPAPANETSVLSIGLTLDVKHADVDQEHSVVKLFADLIMVWFDERITWNETDWGCDFALTAAERLWLPDIVLVNAAATGGSTAPSDVGLRARINHDGRVTWVTRLDLSAPVTLQLYDWPKDTQSCTFKFASRSYTVDQLDLIGQPVRNLVVYESGKWDINDVTSDSSIWTRDDEQVKVAGWTVQLSRMAPAHLLAANTVLLAATLMLAAAVALPPDRRYPLAACASFIAALWLTTALLVLPGGSSCPRVVSVMSVACASGAVCGAAAALARRLARCSSPPPRLLRAALSSLSTVCRLTPSPEACETSESGAWAAASVLLDRALCAALLLTLGVLLAVQLL